MSFDVDDYVRELLEKHENDEYKWFWVAKGLKDKLNHMCWVINYSQDKLKEIERIAS